MNFKTIAITGIIAVMADTSCTSIRTFEEPTISSIDTGELATIYEDSGRISRMIVKDITDTEVIGQYRPNGRLVSVERQDIELVQVERIDTIKSAAEGVGGFVVAAFTMIVDIFGALAIAAA